MSPRHSFALIPTLLLSTACALSAAHAADHEHHDGIPRLVAQALVGTTGFEPGVAAEWRFGSPYLLLRPEVFISDHDGVGLGCSVGWELPFNLPERHAITLGPRVVYHTDDDDDDDDDDYSWGAYAMAIWHFDLVPSQRGRHFLEVIGAVGAILEDRHDNNGNGNGDDDDHDIDPALSIGAAYGFQF